MIGFAFGSPASAADQIYTFDIPAESLSQALVDFSKQSSQEVAFTEGGETGKPVAGLHGQYTIADALHALLADTDLAVDVNPAGVILVLVRDFEKLGNCSMWNSTRSYMLLTGVSAAALSLCATLAQAQDIETVTVTGSRVISDAADSSTPLTTISADALRATTPTDIPDALNKLPQFAGSSQPRWSGSGGSLYGANVLSLRDLGTNRTLVLLDGHRIAPATSAGTVDVDTLPQELMSRVDVVTGGASSVYGSDAIAGVVNFILDKNFNGFKVDAHAGISAYGDAANQKVDLVAGAGLFGGRGHVEVALSHANQDGIWTPARPYGPHEYVRGGAGNAASPYTIVDNGRLSSSTFGGLIACTGCAANGMQFVSSGIIGPFTNGASTGVSNLQSGGDGAYNAENAIMTATRNNNAFGRFSYDIDDTTSVYVQASAAEARSTGPWYNETLNPGANQPNTFFSNNPFLSPTAQAMLSNGTTNTFRISEYVYTAGQDRFNYINSTNLNRNLSVTVGADGTLAGRFAWDLYYTHGEDREKTTNINNLDNQKLQAAEDAVAGPNGSVECYVSTTAYANLYPGCIPIDLFGPNSVTASQFKYVTTNTYFVMTNKMDDLGGSISGPLFDTWAGPVKTALSAEFRNLDYDVVSNASPTQTVDCTGLRNCSPVVRYSQNTIAPNQASENVWEIGGEAEIPLLKDVPLAQSLNLNLAGRYTDYSTSGPVQTWKVGLVYHVNDDVMFRGTTSVDIRAPSLNDLFAPLQQAVVGFSDMHTNTSGSIFQRSQGNPTLVPEVARTYTAGVVVTPSAVPGFMASLDYYHIDLKNAISSASGSSTNTQSICEASGGGSPFCALSVRPYPFSNTSPANFPLYLLSEELNVAYTAVEGWDMETSYHFDMADVWAGAPGSVNMRVLGNYAPVNVSISFPGALPSYTYEPKTRLTGFLSYTLGDWDFDLEDQWVSCANKATSPGQVYAQPWIRAYNQTDITVTRKFIIDDSVLNAYLNISNLFNSQPPLFPTYGTSPGLGYPVPGGNYGGYPYDVVGRFFTLGVRASF